MTNRGAGRGAFRYLSVCSGIEAATVAWHPLGWEAAAFSEIEAFPRALLSHHYPDTPLHGDFTTIGADEYGPIDLLVGGTPCQSFSVAGLRGGLADERGNLALQFLKLAHRTRARWVVWENVPGVLSSNGGRDFGSILGGLVELGYGFAYRVLDAQFFGVPQRRRRVFVVGHLGDWRRAAAVLFERHSLSGHPAPRRETRQRSSASTPCGLEGGELARALTACHTATGRLDANEQTFVAFNITPSNSNKDYNARESERAQAVTCGGNRPSARGGDLIAFTAKDHGADASDISPTLRSGSHSGSHANGGVMPAVAFSENQRGEYWEHDCFQALNKGGGKPGQGYAAIRSAVRRLTPRECERLQGFPDDYTLIPYRGKPASDGPRYKALGNSMAVPVMRFIGERIARVEALQTQAEAA
jgi:DNA (cytosine-5)-methyltransferase 1